MRSKFLVAFYVVMLLFGVFCGCKGFCKRTESNLFTFHLCRNGVLMLGVFVGGPGALYRAQEYHCNLVLVFF